MDQPFVIYVDFFEAGANAEIIIEPTEESGIFSVNLKNNEVAVISHKGLTMDYYDWEQLSGEPIKRQILEEIGRQIELHYF
jgi:hypothetical protein